MFGFRSGGRRRSVEQAPARVNQERRGQNTGEAGDIAAEGAHEAAGRVQEVIRAQLADLSQRHLVVRQAGETLESLERSVMQLLADHHRVRLAADGSRNELISEREQLTRLRQELARVQEEAHGHKQARLQLETALETLQDRINETSTELAAARHELATTQADAMQLRSELAEMQTRATEGEERAAFYRTKHDERQSQIAALEAASKKEEQQAAMLGEEVRMLQDKLEQLNRDLARRDREHADTRQKLEGAEAMRRQLEETLAESVRRHKAAEEAQAEALEQARASGGSLKNRADALASRLQVTEQLLTQARDEIALRTEEHSGAQRQLLQLSLEKAALEKRVEETRKERDRADRLARETSEINARLAERSHGLVASMKARDREYEAAKQKLAALAGELEHARKQLASSEQQFQTHVAELNAQVAHERSSRQMSDGSLEAARSTIDGLRLEIARLRQGSGEVSLASRRGEAARLPVAAQLVTDEQEDGDGGAVSMASPAEELASGVESGADKTGKEELAVDTARPRTPPRRNGARIPAVVVVRAEETDSRQ